MKSTTPEAISWLSPSEIQTTMSPTAWTLINHHDSLTQKLREITNNKIEFHFLSAGWDQAHPEESKALNLPSSEKVWIRNIEMRYRGALWTVGRTIIPKSSLGKDDNDLAAVGKQSLGDVIFKNSSLKRGAFEFCLLNNESPYYQLTKTAQNTATSPIWARRSFIELHGKPLLIIEIFFPDLLSHDAG